MLTRPPRQTAMPALAGWALLVPGTACAHEPIGAGSYVTPDSAGTDGCHHVVPGGLLYLAAALAFAGAWLLHAARRSMRRAGTLDNQIK